MLRLVLHTGDTPRRTAAAFSLGVFLGMSPFLGAHTFLALGLAFLLRLSRPAAFLGTLVLNPWTIVPLYGAGVAVGIWLLGGGSQDLPPLDLGWEGGLTPAAILKFRSALGPYLLPFVVGNLVLGVLGSLVAYPLAVWLVVRFRTLRKRRVQGFR